MTIPDLEYFDCESCGHMFNERRGTFFIGEVWTFKCNICVARDGDVEPYTEEEMNDD